MNCERAASIAALYLCGKLEKSKKVYSGSILVLPGESIAQALATAWLFLSVSW
jgi:hypothetical protein